MAELDLPCDRAHRLNTEGPPYHYTGVLSLRKKCAFRAVCGYLAAYSRLPSLCHRGGQ